MRSKVTGGAGSRSSNKAAPSLGTGEWSRAESRLDLWNGRPVLLWGWVFKGEEIIRGQSDEDSVCPIPLLWPFPPVHILLWVSVHWLNHS